MGGRNAAVASIMLTKHHGLGNDFLIAVEPSLDIGADDAVRWCHRRRGLGADGLIVARQAAGGGDTWVMDLWNSDGSRGAVSGNGLRCLGQALVLNHDAGEAIEIFRIVTDAGERRVEVRPDRTSGTDQVTVDMGYPAPGPPPYGGWHDLGVLVKDQMGVDMGNPHLVALVDDPDRVDLATVGAAVEAAYPDGLNIELITRSGQGVIDLRVWERGARITEACGSGACAAAWAARQWGLVDDLVTVRMPGGTATVELTGGAAVLTGPATFVAIVEIEQP